MTDQLLAVHREQIGATAVVHAVGDIDLGTAPLLERALAEAAGAPGATTVVVNLTGVNFLGSAGLSILVEACAAAVLPMTVVADPEGPPRRALSLTGLEEALSVVDSLEQALG